MSEKILLDVLSERANNCNDEYVDVCLYADFNGAILNIPNFGWVDTRLSKIYTLSNLNELKIPYKPFDDCFGCARKISSKKYLKIQDRIINCDDYVFTDGGVEGNTQYYILINKSKLHFDIISWSNKNILFTKEELDSLEIYHLIVEDNLL